MVSWKFFALERSKAPVQEPLIVPTLAAFSTARGKRLWAKKLDAWYRPRPAVAVETGLWRPTSTTMVAPRSWFRTTFTTPIRLGR